MSPLPAARHARTPPAGRAASPCRLAAARLARELAQQVHPSDGTAAAAQAVQQAASALRALPDWVALRSAFAITAQQHGRAGPAGDSPARGGARGGFGFALRQPGQPRPAPAGVGGALRQQWDWGSVRRLVMLGGGSVCACWASEGGGKRSPRLAFRLGQLALAAALASCSSAQQRDQQQQQQQEQPLLPGLVQAPLAFDPAYEPGDRQLLAALGWQAPEAAPDLAEVSSGALLYMPCCPRELCAELLAAAGAAGSTLAVLGTSWRSFGDSAGLLDALAAAEAGRGGRSSGAGPDPIAQAYADGRVSEAAVRCDPAGAHGVAVSVHLIRPA